MKRRIKSYRELTIDSLKTLVYYDKDTGNVIVNEGIKHSFIEDKDGYIGLHICGYSMRIHRLAWFWVYGEWPEYIDHIDGDVKNNRISNLRSCNIYENGCNRIEHRNGKLVGAYYNKLSGKWRSHIQIQGKLLNLGNHFKNAHDASLAYCRYVLHNKLVRREFLPSVFTDEELGI